MRQDKGKAVPEIPLRGPCSFRFRRIYALPRNADKNPPKSGISPMNLPLYPASQSDLIGITSWVYRHHISCTINHVQRKMTKWAPCPGFALSRVSVFAGFSSSGLGNTGHS